jgi:putative nucleotidyltransferase with HDIG domain
MCERITAMQKVDEILGRVRSLPPSLAPLPELFTALCEPDRELEQVENLITFDPILTTKVLQVCNSAAFGTNRNINDVREAINRIGFRTVYRIVASVKGSQAFTAEKGGPASELWRHAVLAAFAGQFLAEDLSCEAGIFFTAGLLHDLGKSILSHVFQKSYWQLLGTAKQTNTPLVDLELKAFGVEHSMLAGRMLERWNFSPELVAGVRHHHSIQTAGSFVRQAAHTSAASCLAHLHDGDKSESLSARMNESLKVLGFSADDAQQYVARLHENISFVELMVRMAN